MDQSVVVVQNIPRPYRLALFETVRSQLASTGHRLCVLYTSDPSDHVRRGADQDVLREHGAQYVRSFGVRIGYEKIITFPTSLFSELKRQHAVCVVAAGFSVDAMLSATWCKATGTPYVVWSGAWPDGERNVGRLRLAVRRRLVKEASGYLSYGSAAADYLATLGAKPNCVFPVWNTVDIEAISAGAHIAATNRSKLAAKYGLASNNLLFVGSMVDRKGVQELVAAALTLPIHNVWWTLHLVGDGPLRERLEHMVRAAGRESFIRFHGLRPSSDVTELLGVADGLLLPSKCETWGLVINEAMACAVPVAVSPQAGATRDLVEHEVTGYVVNPKDEAGLASVMRLMINRLPSCVAVGEAGARAIREKASLQISAKNFVAGVHCAIGKTSRER